MYLLSSVLLLIAQSLRSVHALDCSVATFAPVLPSNATILQAVFVPQGGTFGNGAANLEFPPGNGTDLPELCAVEVNVTSSATSSYRFGLFLPTSWNNRYLASGNGGFGGGINWPGLGTYSRYGFASMSTDTGHSSISFDASWALNNPESQIDWGYRAMHGSIVLSKLLTDTYYTTPHKYSYYSGCSTGGRQGFKEAEEFPDDFDGVLAGAPAWWTTHLQPWSEQVALNNLPATSPAHIPDSLMTGPVAAEVLRQCDPQDGVTDGIISRPYSCSFDPTPLLCQPGTTNTSTCLTSTQLPTLTALYRDWLTLDTQAIIFPHYALGSEAQSGFLFNPTNETPSAAATTYIANFLFNNASWDWHNFSYSTVVQYADATDPGNATADNFDLTPFQQRGGKLIHYHGYADGLIATGSSFYLHSAIKSTLTALGFPDLASFYRFFPIPGMQHCMDSPVAAPWVIAGDGQTLNATAYSVPGFVDADHDALLALVRWVEQGTAPAQIIASKFDNDSATGAVVRQRPLCPWPQVQKYDGKGDVDLAASWSCADLY